MCVTCETLNVSAVIGRYLLVFSAIPGRFSRNPGVESTNHVRIPELVGRQAAPMILSPWIRVCCYPE